MALALAEYKPQTFDALTSPDAAYEKQEKNNGEDLLDTKLKDIAFAHNMRMKRADISTHPPYRANADERVVAAQLSATPWTEAAIALINASGLGTVAPSFWMLSEDDKVLPFEYVFQRRGEGSGSPSVGGEATQEFLDDVFNVIQGHGLGSVLGSAAVLMERFSDLGVYRWASEHQRSQPRQ
ncbi:hypothetical protein EWM64_g9685 [Hericium alpestre]|uniref:Uncharacterized protein n=1 Tax=Hericium alpestre TaxID=135208 RepID=A0A4Y9ZLB8_9AGAM|nr:hypothetical protein EWM64_g9685 [Hericium alpestre]